MKSRYGKVGGAIDHLGTVRQSEIVKKGGRIVNIAFGEGRMKTAKGFGQALTHRYSSPKEQVCSIPLFVQLQRKQYRQKLTSILRLAANGDITPPAPVEIDFRHYDRAIAKSKTTATNTKTILTI